MESVGRLLAEARQAKGLSLEEMEDRTKIKQRYLAFMEAGQFTQLPDAAYVRAFIRLYARELGLDAGDVLQQYESAKRPSRQPEANEADDNIGRPKERETWQSVWLWLLLAALLVAGVLGGWYAALLLPIR